MEKKFSRVNSARSLGQPERVITTPKVDEVKNK